MRLKALGKIPHTCVVQNCGGKDAIRKAQGLRYESSMESNQFKISLVSFHPGVAPCPQYAKSLVHTDDFWFKGVNLKPL